MKCEQCLPLLEEYVDGELSERSAGRVTSHLGACVACATAHRRLTLEAEIFARYQPEIEVTPALWNSVRARIAQSGPAQPAASRPSFVGRLIPVWAAVRFHPALTSALALLIIGLALGLARYIQPRTAVTPFPQVAYRRPDTAGRETRPDFPSAPSPDTTGHDMGREKSNDIQSHGLSSRNVPESKIAASRHLSKAGLARVNPGPDTYRSAQAPVPPAGLASAPAVIEPDMTAGLGSSWNAPQSASEEETIRHLEQSQVLLRSFRNASFSAKHPEMDVAYEKRQSRQLLYRNILLRRDAAAKGNLPMEDALNGLEPVLLDIANLPDKPSQGDVRLIKDRIQKNEIVAELQVYTARNSATKY